jgi:hypothetical protein
MGGGGQQGGGDIMSAIGRMMNYSSGPSTIATGGGPQTPIGGVDIPPADFNDPFGGIRGEVSPGDFNSSPFGLSQINGFGNNPSFGAGAFGGTQLPTWWTNYPGVGNVPFAVPNTPGGWIPPVGEDLSHHTPPKNSV